MTHRLCVQYKCERAAVECRRRRFRNRCDAPRGVESLETGKFGLGDYMRKRTWHCPLTFSPYSFSFPFFFFLLLLYPKGTHDERSVRPVVSAQPMPPKTPVWKRRETNKGEEQKTKKILLCVGKRNSATIFHCGIAPLSPSLSLLSHSLSADDAVQTTRALFVFTEWKRKSNISS